MKFFETNLKGAYMIEIEPINDERGFFARTWCEKEFADHGVNPKIVQCNVSYNSKKGTIRGMHYQASPFEEAKLIRCIRGSIYDVIIDLRSSSATYKKWISVCLSDQNRKMLFVPKGFAHGFQTLENHTEVLYQMSEYYHSNFSRGIRFNDPNFQIEWPVDDIEITISKKDMAYKDFIK